MSILHDFHMHSAFSADSNTPAELMAARAVDLGLSGICFTDHQDTDAPIKDPLFEVNFEQYFSSLMQLRELYRGKLDIGIGMEYGIQPHLADDLKYLTTKYSYDFIIASVHFLYGSDPYYSDFFDGRDEAQVYHDYFCYQLDCLKALSNFDTLGHLDYVTRYGPDRKHVYSYKKFADSIDPLLKHIITSGKCLEVNTGGYRHVGETNPCIDILRRYRELGGERITIGSDAHNPGHMALEFNRTEELLKSLGFTYYVIFQERKGTEVFL